MKLSQIPEAVCTLPEIDFVAAKRASYWLELQHGVQTTVWKIQDKLVLVSDDYRWIGRKFMMIEVVDAAYVFEGLDIEPPSDF